MAAEQRTIELQLPSSLGYERVAMEAVGAAAKLMGFHAARVEDLRTAVSEACINAMEHGHQFNAATKVVVALTLGDTSLQIDVADKGKGTPDRIQPPDLTKMFSGEQQVRGWGMFLIKALMDEVQFNVRSDLGNVTRMVIRLEPSDEEHPPTRWAGASRGRV
jgi:serine/threonine-protein kinase RsbW